MTTVGFPTVPADMYSIAISDKIIYLLNMES